MGRAAIFLDRDGVLNEVVFRDGKPASPRLPEELALVEDAAPALARLKAAGLLLLVATNQPDIARGRMSPQALLTIHADIAARLPVDDIAVCPHDDHDGCGCRKPRPGLLLDLAARHDVDLSRSWFIGDQARDVACGRAAGCRTVLLARPYNHGATADVVVESLWQAVTAILAAEAPFDDALQTGAERDVR